MTPVRVVCLLCALTTVACNGSKRIDRSASGRETSEVVTHAPVGSCDTCEAGTCTAEDAGACHALAIRYGRGRGVPFDLERKARYEQVACDHGSAGGCRALAELHQDGVGGLAHDDALAAKLYERACGQGDGQSCSSLGWMHQYGEIGVVDAVQAKAWYARSISAHERGCDRGDADDCALLGAAYRDGYAVAPDDAKAYAAFERGCPRSSESCIGLALALIAGRGVEKDVAKGQSMLERACGDDVTAACGMLGQELWLGQRMPADPRRALDLLTKACDDNDAVACGALGAHLEGHTGVPRDAKASLDRRERACLLRNRLACREAADFLLDDAIDGDAARARRFLSMGCNIGDGAACGMLATLLRQGRGGPIDEPVAQQLYGEACRRTANTGFCVDLLVRRVPLPLTPEDADFVRADACRRGVDAACPPR